MNQCRVFRFPLFITIISAVLVSLAQAQETAAEIEDPLQAGLAAIDAGDLIGAVDSLRIAAEEGSSEAQVWLGYILDYSEEDEEAVAYYRAAAELGDARGMAGLGAMYAKGEGVEQDLDEARKHYTEAAEMGHAGSMRALLMAYEQGGLGVEADASKAEYWKARLAELAANEE